MLIYLPIAAADLGAMADMWNAYRRGRNLDGNFRNYATFRHGDAAVGGILGGLTKTDILFVLCHGRRSTSSQIGAQTGTTRNFWGRTKAVYEYLTADELTMRLISAGLTRDAGDIRLLICWAGIPRGSEAPFAGQLSSAMKKRGFYRIVVTGYTGAIESFAEATNVIISKGFGNRTFTRAEGLAADRGGDAPAELVSVGNESRSLGSLLIQNGWFTGPGPDKSVWY